MPHTGRSALRLRPIPSQSVPCRSMADMQRLWRCSVWRRYGVTARRVGEHSYSTSRYPIAAGRPDERDCREAEAFGRAVAAKLASHGVRRIDAAALPGVRNGMLSTWRFLRFVLGYRRKQKHHPARVAVETSAERCTHCGHCVEVCPTEAVAAGDELHTDASRCIRCCACVKGCPAGARSYDSPFAPVLSHNFPQRKPNRTKV